MKAPRTCSPTVTDNVGEVITKSSSLNDLVANCFWTVVWAGGLGCSVGGRGVGGLVCSTSMAWDYIPLLIA